MCQMKGINVSINWDWDLQSQITKNLGEIVYLRRIYDCSGPFSTDIEGGHRKAGRSYNVYTTSGLQWLARVQSKIIEKSMNWRKISCGSAYVAIIEFVYTTRRILREFSRYVTVSRKAGQLTVCYNLKNCQENQVLQVYFNLNFVSEAMSACPRVRSSHQGQNNDVKNTVNDI